MIIAVDFDGMLCENAFPEIGKPIEKIIRYIQKANRDGHIITLWTCREGIRLENALSWCKDNDIQIDYVNSYPNIDCWPDFSPNDPIPCRKIFADIYIDDKAINIKDIYPDNWSKWGDKALPKKTLIKNYYYGGICRQANIAKWDGEKFIHWREKFGNIFLEDIEYWDINGYFDGFIPLFEIGEKIPKEII